MNEQQRRDNITPQEQISVHAYYLWQQRGCPIGSPEADWFRAVQEVDRNKTMPSQPVSRLAPQPLSTRATTKTPQRRPGS